ncbi:MAG: heme A synthase, partial [Acidimicrobiales bacterium]
MLTTRRLSWLALVATLVLVAIGGFTRGSGSGYGCQDRWPLCENGLLGGLLPRAEYHMVVEWTHRWVASTVGVLALATAVTAWRRHRREPMIVVPAVAAVFTIGVQAWVGRLVVKRNLDADLVSVHLAISMAVVALLTMVVVATRPAASRATPAPVVDRAWTVLLAAAATGSLVLLLLCSYVHNLYVSGWPLVGNTVLPDLSNRFVAVHYSHRVLAGLGFLYLIFLASAANRRQGPRVERVMVYAAGAAYFLDIGL